jgi:hypothetical protein
LVHSLTISFTCLWINNFVYYCVHSYETEHSGAEESI